MEKKMMYMSNEAAEQREQLVFGRAYNRDTYKMGGCCRFEGLDVATANLLVALGYLDPEDRQNSSPTAREIIDFCNGDDRDIWNLHGYVISPERADCRVTIEGCKSKSMPSADRIIDFAKTFRDADDFYVDSYCYCWYD